MAIIENNDNNYIYPGYYFFILFSTFDNILFECIDCTYLRFYDLDGERFGCQLFYFWLLHFIFAHFEFVCFSNLRRIFFAFIIFFIIFFFVQVFYKIVIIRPWIIIITIIFIGITFIIFFIPKWLIYFVWILFFWMH